MHTSILSLSPAFSMDDDTDRLANSMDDIADPTSSSSAAMSSSSEEDSVGDSVRRRVCSERGRGGRRGRGVGRGRGRGVGRGRGRGRGRGGGRGRGRGRGGGTNISPQDLKILMGPWEKKECNSFTHLYSGSEHGPVTPVTSRSAKDAFCRFFTDELWDLLVVETNRYAAKCRQG